MGDPLSTAASIAGLISVAGQTVETVVYLHEIFEKLRDAPNEIHDLDDELRAIEAAATQVQELCTTARAKVNHRHAIKLEEHLRQCNDGPLAKIKKVANELIAKNKGSLSIANRARWLLAEGKISKRINSLARHETILNTQISAMIGYG